MSRCGCSKNCNCVVAQNGVPIVTTTNITTSEVEFLPSSRVGWRDNKVDGNGRPSNPYSVSFRDSLHYRPSAAEWRQTGPDFYTTQWISGNPTVYSTPSNESILVWSEAFYTAAVVSESGVMIGTWVNINTFGVAAPLELIIVASIADVSGPFNIAGQATQTVNPILSCVGYLNPIDSGVSIGSTGINASIVVQIFNPSSAALQINDIRLWAVEV